MFIITVSSECCKYWNKFVLQQLVRQMIANIMFFIDVI